MIALKNALQDTPSTCADSPFRSTSMPKIISYTPPWLSRPSPASQAFTNSPSHDWALSKSSSHPGSPTPLTTCPAYEGPHRLLVQRGTEIFVVVGNQIRWLDLRMVKDDWREQQSHAVNRGDLVERQASQFSPYRVCRNEFLNSSKLVLTQTGTGCASLSTDTPTDDLSLWQFSCYLDGAYGTHRHPTRCGTFGSQ